MPPEPDPIVYANGRAITEADVIETMEGLGDDTLAAYRDGRISKTKAYRMAAHCLRQGHQLKGMRLAPHINDRLTGKD